MLSEWQIFYAALICLATVGGWGRWRLIAILWANFAFTVAFADLVWLVIAFDLACVGLLAGRGRLSDFVAAMFVVMVPIHLTGWGLSWPIATTYAIIEPFGWAQCLVVACSGFGGSRLVDWGRRAAVAVRGRAGRVARGAFALALRSDAQKDS
jgi:hypothetical protein